MLELIIHGGWALWVITGCSVVALAVTLERWRTLRRASIDSEALLGQVSEALERGDVDAAIAVCSATPGPIAETLRIGLRKLSFLERIGKKPEEIEEGIVAAMEEHGGHVFEFLERNLTMLATVASMAPMLGMMGTVIGMIRAFGGVALSGNLTPGVVAGGIAEALLCTAGGLIVASIATVSYNYYTTRVNRFVLRVQSAATQLVERVLDLHSARAAKERAAAEQVQQEQLKAQAAARARAAAAQGAAPRPATVARPAAARPAVQQPASDLGSAGPIVEPQ